MPMESFPPSKVMKLNLQKGVTQLLDQINQSLHQSYKNCKDELFTPHQTINRDGFMIILANLWGDWVSNESIRKAAKRVGIAEDGLSINYMQKDKFKQAENIMEGDGSESDEPGPSQRSIVDSPKDVRKGSALYWQMKYEMSRRIIEEANEKSLKLEEIPGLLPINKVKPKKSVQNMRVTQICGSMEGKDVLKVVESIKKNKEEKESAKKAKQEKKRQQKEVFFRCKEKCVCGKPKCDAFALKECSNCHDILQSVCSKTACKVDGKCPKMIYPANHKTTKRKLIPSDDEECVSDYSIDSREDDTEDEIEEDESEVEEDESEVEEVSIEDQLRNTWNSFSPPVDEKEIQGKWFAVIYASKRKKMLFIARLNQRFLVDENGPVEKLLMTCLKPKVGMGTLLEETPKHLPADEGMFDPWDIIYGPTPAVPHGTNKFDVPEYENARKLFDSVKNLDREEIFHGMFM